MQDRASLYPGRVKLVPVAGQENTYDMVRADSPTQDGTPLNKDSLLKDATAAMYGLPNTAVPDEVLALLNSLVKNAQTSADEKAKIQTGSYVGTGTYGAANPCSLTFDFVPKFLYIKSTNSSSAGFFLPHTLTNTFKYYAYQGFIQNTAIQSSNCYGKMEETTLSWYYTMVSEGVGSQFNTSGTYHYIALS